LFGILQILGDNGTGFVYGDKLTMADVSLLEPLLNVVEYFGSEAFNDFPNLKVCFTNL